MDFLLTPEGLLSLVMLIFMEIVLGIDNIIFISIVSNRLPEDKQPKARNIGLLLAMLFRIILLFGITWVLKMQKPLFSFDSKYIYGNLSGQSLILFLGGIFLLYKSSSEIHHKLEGIKEQKRTSVAQGLLKVIFQISLLNIVFSFDSILTAIGLTKSLTIMVIAIVASIIVMMVFAGPVSRFVNRHPSIQMLGLSFLILIGFMLIAEAAHVAHFSLAGVEIGAIPKGYLYFAIFFSLCVEILNIRVRKKTKPVVLQYPKLEEAVKVSSSYQPQIETEEENN